MPIDSLSIDADFPGGNIVVEAAEHDHARLRQDWSTSTEWWFYWAFRVRGAAGRRVRFTLCDRDVLSAEGPCLSHDPRDSRSWRWLGRPAAAENGPEASGQTVGFDYTFGPGEHEAYFALCPLYTGQHLAQFAAREPRVRRGGLGPIENGSDLEHLWLPSARGRYVVPFLARTHACEAMASFVLEGLFEFWLQDPGGDAAWLREWVDFRAVPFVDQNGVENGEPGKFRIPHDHNRDWTAQPRYAATRAIVGAAPTWRGEMPLFLDLHCPWIRGGRNEELFFVGIAPPGGAELARFCAILEGSQRGPLPYSAVHTMPFGREWNRGTEPTAQRWFKEQFPVRFASTLEVPYSRAGGIAMTPDNARAFGHDVARAIALYLQGVVAGCQIRVT